MAGWIDIGVDLIKDGIGRTAVGTRPGVVRRS